MNLVNHAPDSDTITIGGSAFDTDYRIVIERDESGQVYVTLYDLMEGAEARAILGVEGVTVKV